MTPAVSPGLHFFIPHCWGVPLSSWSSDISGIYAQEEQVTTSASFRWINSFFPLRMTAARSLQVGSTCISERWVLKSSQELKATVFFSGLPIYMSANHSVNSIFRSAAQTRTLGNTIISTLYISGVTMKQMTVQVLCERPWIALVTAVPIWVITLTAWITNSEWKKSSDIMKYAATLINTIMFEFYSRMGTFTT